MMMHDVVVTITVSRMLSATCAATGGRAKKAYEAALERYLEKIGGPLATEARLTRLRKEKIARTIAPLYATTQYRAYLRENPGTGVPHYMREKKTKKTKPA